MVERIAVVGGAGRIGAQVVRSLETRGIRAASLSRRTGFDLQRSSADQLVRALDGVDALIDCSDAADRTIATFEASARALSLAAGRAGVERIVAVSIVGIDRPGLAKAAYYQGKLAQERGLAAGTVPVTVVRTTQWFGFADQIFPHLPLGGFGRVGLAPRMRMQPVANSAVGDRLARAALDDAPGTRVELAGPEQLMFAELIRRVWRARDVRARVAQVPIPGVPGFADGSLLPGPDAELDTTTIEQWVATGR